MALGKRVKLRRKQLGITQEQLAKKVGVGITTINKLEARDNKSSQKSDEIAKALNVSLDWLVTGQETPSNQNVSLPPDLNNKVPLLGKVSAGNFIHTAELEIDQVETWLMSPKNYNGKAFGLRIDGDSMASPIGKSYPDGGIAVFNAGNKTPNNGSLVLAKICGSDEITFKKYVEDAGNKWLMPLNQNYPRIDDHFIVLAVFEYAIVY